jgi:hypothetical protein
MPRKLVTDSELVEIINSALSQQEECDGCRVKGLMKSEEDETGCNWSDPYLNCSGTPAEVCLPVANHVIGKIRQEYNLK